MMINKEQRLINNKQQAINNKQLKVAVYPHWSIVNIFAQFFSYVFHPLFVPLYVISFLIFIHPFYFSGFSKFEIYSILFSTILNTIFFPAFTVLLMKRLGFIQSIFLKTQNDRVGPYLSSMIFYFWTAWVFFKMESNPPLILPSFMVGVFLTTIVGLLSNIYLKISMHAMAIGGWLGLFLIIMYKQTMLMTWPLSITLLIAGAVCTSRLIVSNHSNKEIYVGLFLGILCQVAAAMFVL